MVRSYGYFVIDPVVMLTSNNKKWTQTHLLEEALPQMFWNQPRNNRRAVYLTQGYMSPTFAEGLADLMGCPVERSRLPDDDFLEEARRPPPIY
eukprot:11822868-Karenia_brevis.AAC.1